MKSVIIRFSTCTEENMEKYFTNLKVETIQRVIKNTFKISSFCYPTFDYWLDSKVIPELLLGKRDILFVFDAEASKKLFGLAILKLGDTEKKICSFRIEPDYQRNGLGKELMLECFDVLGTDKPMITVPRDRSLSLTDPENCYAAFDNFIRKYFPKSFELRQKAIDYYREGFTEYVYNGILPLKDLKM